MLEEDRTDGKKCAQCGNTAPAHGFTTKKVIHRKWDQRNERDYVGATLFTVCKDQPCGGYLQMAYEG